MKQANLSKCCHLTSNLSVAKLPLKTEVFTASLRHSVLSQATFC